MKISCTLTVFDHSMLNFKIFEVTDKFKTTRLSLVILMAFINIRSNVSDFRGPSSGIKL